MHVTETEYKEHPVFAELEKYADFYSSLGGAVFLSISMGTGTIGNIDTYLFSSMQGTMESIKTILLAGRINDAYALLRKYHDSTIINVYSNLYLQDHFSLENFVVEKIRHWVDGKEKIPEFRLMSQYIKSSKTLNPIKALFEIDNRYKKLRERCNDHTHYNFFQHMMLNDNEVYIKNRVQLLNIFSKDVRDIFILHMGYILFLNNHYMRSSDYTDALDCNMQPEEDSEYWVAPFIQAIFDEVITPNRPDITAIIKSNSPMQLK